ncbi:hypothetical protein EDB86DRAFT_2827679 [Lactarius hatsudake]|nr:hypothetical protein EDB86DRAFT_2827679 [Lactarius hatsudake]
MSEICWGVVGGPARRVRATTGLSRGATQLREAALRSFGLQDDERWGWYPLQRATVKLVYLLRAGLHSGQGSGLDSEVGLAPTERDNNEEGLAPSTTGLERDCLAALRGVDWTVDFLATLREVTVTVTTAAGLYTRGRRWS